MMAAAPSLLSNEVDLDALVQSLPACRRCRSCRRGCDTLLPKCRQCTKANVDCIFFDHGRNDYLHRSYIAELMDHVRKLSQAGAPPAASQAQPSPTTAETPSTIVSSSTVQAESVTSEQHHYEHHFAFAGGSYRYLGANSCLVKSPRLRKAEVRTPVVPGDSDWEFSWTSSKTYDLVLTYLDVIHPLYPILDPSLRFLAPSIPPDLVPAERFCLNMVYSVACYLEPDRNRNQHPKYHWRQSGKLDFHHFASEKYRSLAENFFAKAMDDLEEATMEPTIVTLRALLLLAINSLFDPQSGNIGQQIALASRLAFSLEAKLEAHEPAPEEAIMMRNMRSTIFCIENEIASTLDRPACFPEPEWPIRFDKTQPSDYLCSLYRLQHRYRKGDQSVKSLLPLLDERAELMPGLRMALHQTHLLLNPCWGSAWHVLEAVVSHGSIHVFLTPHWVYRAGCVLVENLPNIFEWNLIQLYSNALVILELSSGKWPHTGVLRDSLVELMHRMKTKHRPHWEARGLQLYDVIV